MVATRRSRRSARRARACMIVGLAPGLRGANRTGRPFTGDYAGDLLYETLIRFGFAAGAYGRTTDDGLATRRLRHRQRRPLRAAAKQADAAGDRGLSPLSVEVDRGAPRSRGRARARTGGARHGVAGVRRSRSRVSLRPWRAPRPEREGPRRVRQLPLLTLQHQHGRADRSDVPGRFRLDPDAARALLEGVRRTAMATTGRTT